MIPYLGWSFFSLGPVEVSVWGLFVAFGMAAACVIATRSLEKPLGERVWQLLPWVILGSVVGARLLHVFGYEPGFYLAHPLEILRLNHGGLSSTGGLLGGGVTLLLWLRRQRRVRENRLAFLNAIAFATPIGFAIGRLGCYAAHHHLSHPSESVFATRFPDGIARIDLGLVESAVCAVLFLLFLGLRRQWGMRPPFFVGLFLVSYGALRITLDAFRDFDERYMWLTPAQWIACGAVMGGGVVLWRVWQETRLPKKT